MNRASQKVDLVLFKSKRLYFTKHETAGTQMASCGSFSTEQTQADTEARRILELV